MDYRRDYLPGATYFFTVTINHRRPILIDEIDRLRQAFRHTMKARPFKIVAIVVLPDHLHSIWTLPQGDADFSFRWQQIKRSFSTGLAPQAVSRSNTSKHEKGIWQRRFWEHRIRDEDDWRRHLDYIHYNPVKHGYVSRPDLWPHSSFSRFVARGVYDPDWGASRVVEFDIPVGE